LTYVTPVPWDFALDVAAEVANAYSMKTFSYQYIENTSLNVEPGIFMQTNLSWSIDDSRNKFQFGCEWAQLIEKGELTQVVKNPNYRGISATFWRNLKKVGNADSFEILGLPNCGKGEPNQVIRVGHASPVCLFDNVDVFGGV